MPVRSYHASEVDRDCVAVSTLQGQLGKLGQFGDVPIVPRHVGDVVELRKLFTTSMEGRQHEVVIPSKPEARDSAGKITQHHQEKCTIDLGKVDLVVFGSPCQDLSGLNRHGKGLEGEKSGLFFEGWEIIKLVKKAREQQGKKEPYFLVENVASMKDVDRHKISEVLGIECWEVRKAKLRSFFFPHATDI